MSRPPEIFRFEGDGVSLAGERWVAERSRGDIVLLHGGGQTRHSWARTAERLADAGWTAIAYDARGHGDSEWHPLGDYTLDAFVADLLALARTLASPPVLIGASLGGITSLVPPGEHPGLVRGLVLVDIVIELEREGADRILAFLAAHRDGFASLEEVADAITAYNPLRRRPRNLDGLRKNVRQHADGRWYWHWDRRSSGSPTSRSGQRARSPSCGRVGRARPDAAGAGVTPTWSATPASRTCAV